MTRSIYSRALLSIDEEKYKYLPAFFQTVVGSFRGCGNDKIIISGWKNDDHDTKDNVMYLHRSISNCLW